MRASRSALAAASALLLSDALWLALVELAVLEGAGTYTTCGWGAGTEGLEPKLPRLNLLFDWGVLGLFAALTRFFSNI